MQIGVLEADGFSPEARARLASIGTVSTFDAQQDLREFLKPLDALFVRLAYRIDSEFLSMAPGLRWLCSPTTGHNHVDEAVLSSRGVRLLSLRGERAFLDTIRATPEHTFGLILALLRRYAKAFSDTAAGKWDRDACRGEELFGNQVGIIGLGRVGYRLASYCSAFGASVCWCDPAEVSSQPEWRRLPDIRSVIESSRIVVLCASHQHGQQPILGASEIETLKGRHLVNTARGELIDEAALLSAIRGNHLAGVAVDVVENENGEHRLEAWRALMPAHNVIMTPHIGGATYGAMARTEIFVADKLLKSVADGADDAAG